jgi:putative flippase GtrA
MPKISQKEKTRFLKFAIVGISGTLIDLGLFNLFNQKFGVQPIFAKAYSFSLAVFNNFIWNRLWTYPESKELPFLEQFFQYLLVSIIGLLINLSIFALFDSRLIQFFDQILPSGFLLSSTVIGHNIAVAFATIVVLFWNYLANRLWTFRSIQ